MNSQLEHVKKQTRIITAGTDDSNGARQCLNIRRNINIQRPRRNQILGVCDHCKGKGHIRPYCFKLHGESKQSQQKPYKKIWNPRSINTGLIAHTSLRASSKEDWYSDNGCSRHMTGVDKYVEYVRPYASIYVTFGDGAKGKFLGIGNLIKNGLPRLDDVLLVKGLTANLISISQLCDQGLEVKFTKPEC